MEYRRTITLKDGRECLLRNCTKEDGQAALDVFVLTHEQTDYLLTYPDENTFTAEDEGRFLQEKADSEREIEIIAEVDGAAAGLAGIEAVGNKYKLLHRADLGISIDRAYWGLGIGRALLDACLECARAAGYEQVELNVVAENRRAIDLYRRVGFTEYGRFPKGFRSRVSGYQDVVYMRAEL